MPMLLLAAATLAATAPDNDLRSAVRASAQATATIRIISGVRLHWTGEQSPDVPLARMSAVRTPEGVQKARLIEFE